MKKICLNKLSTNILTTCALPVHGVKELYLMHVEDVTPSVSSLGYWNGVTFAPNAKSYRVEGYKQNIQVTTAVRSLDASNKLDITISFKIPGLGNRGNNLEAILLGGRFYVLVMFNNMSSFVAGAISPLECTGFDWDSNANGLLATVTLSAPDGSAGNYLTLANDPSIEMIISKAS